MLSHTSRRLRSAFFCSTTSMLFLLLVIVGCGGGEGGQDQQQENQDQASEETANQEATQETTIQGETTNEELAPVNKVTADRQYVGRVEGTDALVGFAVREQSNELIAYACDGPPDRPPEEPVVAAWFQGPIEEGRARLSDAEGEPFLLEALVSEETVTGTISDGDGQAYEFEAEPVNVEGEAGLYWSEPLEGEGLSSRDGTIVLVDGEARGARHTGGVNKNTIETKSSFTGGVRVG